MAERLGIGHWPLLLAYASLPWLYDAARRVRSGERALPVMVLWLALAARRFELSGRVVALEHSAKYAGITDDLLVAHGAAAFADVRVLAQAGGFKAFEARAR